MSWLGEREVAFQVDPALVAGADHDGLLIPATEDVATFAIPGTGPIVEHRVAEAVIAADHATRLLAGALVRGVVEVAGRRAVDLACGSGVLAVLLARLGATSVVATDISEHAAACARATARANGAEIDVVVSDMLQALPPSTRFDLLVATLPHKPSPPRDTTLCLAQGGGPDGDALFRRLLPELPSRLARGGVVLFHLHSLTTPTLLRDMAALGTLTLHAWRRRFFQPGEYGPLHAYFAERAARGSSYLTRDAARSGMLCGIWSLRDVTP